jgi:hypothetical protein
LTRYGTASTSAVISRRSHARSNVIDPERDVGSGQVGLPLVEHQLNRITCAVPVGVRKVG